LCALRARTADVLEVEPACSDELAKPTRCSSSKVGFGLTGGVANFGGVEADEPDVGVLVINLEGIAVDDPDIGGVDGLGKGWCRQEQRGDAGCYREAREKYHDYLGCSRILR
jgi:hypothetical protein